MEHRIAEREPSAISHAHRDHGESQMCPTRQQCLSRNGANGDEFAAVGLQNGFRAVLESSSRREKTLGNVGIPRVFFVAGAGFEPATFGL